MKKSYLLLLTAVLTMFVVNGCYTQLARQERQQEHQEDEPEYTETEAVEQEQDYNREEDYRRVTNVYVYDDDYYYQRYGWDRWDPWGYRYPHRGWSVAVGYGYYDPYYYDPFWVGGWCGAGWDPWWGRDYYSPWSRPVHGYYPIYDPYPNYGGGGGVLRPEKRPFGRRSGTRTREENPPSNVAAAQRKHLNRPDESIYVRNEDGSYRRERRRIVEPVKPAGDVADTRSNDRRRISPRDTEPAKTGGAVSSPNQGGTSAVSKPARTPDVQAQPATRRAAPRERSGRKQVDGEPNERRAKPKEQTQPARDEGSSRRVSGSSNSGNSSSGSSSSGNSSSTRGSSSSGSSNNGGSSRRSRN